MEEGLGCREKGHCWNRLTQCRKEGVSLKKGKVLRRDTELPDPSLGSL